MASQFAIPSWNNVLYFYDYLTLHIVPGPRSWRYFVPLLLLFGALIVPETSLSHKKLRWTFLPMIYLAQIYVWQVDGSLDVISTNALLSAFMLVGWYDVRKDFKRLRTTTDNKAEDAGSKSASVLTNHPQRLTERIVWAVDLLSSIRLTGWQTPANSRGLPTKPWHESMESFYLSNMGKGICVYMILDQTSQYVKSSSSFIKSNQVEIQLPWYIEMFVILLHLGCALALYNAFLPIALTVILAPFPALRKNSSISPLCWPAHFGSLSWVWNAEIPGTPLSKFWGVFWHQNMRYITSTPGIAIVHTIGPKRNSRLRYILIVTISFFLSGIVHMGVIPAEPVGTELSCWRMRPELALFFWVQPAGIAAEMLFMANVRKRIGYRLAQAFSILWVVMYLSITAWFTVRPVGREMGWWNIHLVPVSVYSWL